MWPGLAARPDSRRHGGNGFAGSTGRRRARRAAKCIRCCCSTTLRAKHCAVPIELVSRVERVRAGANGESGRTPHHAVLRRQPAAGHPARCRRGGRAESKTSNGWWSCSIARAVRWVCWPPNRWIWSRRALVIDTVTLRQTGVAGSALLNGPHHPDAGYLRAGRHGAAEWPHRN